LKIRVGNGNFGGSGLQPHPAELADLSELFTPRYIVHRLAELVDQDSDDRRIAQELRHLRPWLDLKTFCLREANQRLGRQIGARP